MKSIIFKLSVFSICTFSLFSCGDEGRLSDTERPLINKKKDAVSNPTNAEKQSGGKDGNSDATTNAVSKWTPKQIEKFRFFLLDKKEVSNIYQFGLNGNVDLNGEDADDLSVLLFDKAGKLVQEAKLDKNGKFKFNKLDPSEYSLVLSNPDLKVNANLQVVDGDNKYFLTNADPKVNNHIPANAKKRLPSNSEKVWTAEEIKKFRFYALDKSKSDDYSSFSLNGHIDNTGLNGEDLSVLLFNGKGKPVQKVKVDAQGNFAFNKLKPSEYSMVLSQPDLKVNADVQIVDAEDAKIVEKKRVQSQNNLTAKNSDKVWTAEEIKKFRFYALDKSKSDDYSSFSLNGHIDNTGLNGEDLSVLLFNKEGKPVQTVKVDAKGNFAFNKLKPSEYSMVLSQPDLKVNADVQIVDAEDAKIIEKKRIQSQNNLTAKNSEKVWTAEEIKKFRFYALDKSKSDDYSSFSLNGHIDNTGLNGEDLSVLLFNKEGKPVQTVKVDAKGNFAFNKLKPSEYSMVLSQPDLKVNADVQIVDAENAKIIENKRVQSQNNLSEKSNSIKVGDKLAEMEVEKRLLARIQKDSLKSGPYDVKGKIVRGSSLSAAITPVYLVNEKGEVVDKKVSDKDGNFTFNKLEGGNYSVILEKPNTDIKVQVTYEYKDESTLVAPFTANQILTQKEIDALPNALVEESSFLGHEEADLKGKVFKNSALRNQKEESLWLVDETGKLIKSTSYDKDGLFVFDHTEAHKYQVVMEGATLEQATLNIIAPEQPYQKEFSAKDDSNLVTLLSKPLMLKNMKEESSNATMNVRESQQTASVKEAFRLYKLAVSKVKRDDYEGAKEDLKKALELRPDYVDAYILHGKACELTKKYDDAIADYNAVLDFRPNHLTAMYLRAYAENEKGDYERAIEDFTKVIKIYPGFSYPYFYRGVAENQLNQHQLAIDDYQRMINIDSTEHEAYFNKGGSYFQLGKYEDAIRNYNKALTIDSLNPDVYHNRGQVYQIIGDYPKALNDFDKAIQFGPIRNSYFEKGNTHSMMQDETSAEKYIEAGVAAFPNDGESYSQRGIYKYNHNKLESALEDFDKAISLNSTSGEYYFKRGVVYAQLGNTKDACNDFVKAKSLNYTDPEEEIFRKKYCKNVK